MNCGNFKWRPVTRYALSLQNGNFSCHMADKIPIGNRLKAGFRVESLITQTFINGQAWNANFSNQVCVDRPKTKCLKMSGHKVPLLSRCSEWIWYVIRSLHGNSVNAISKTEKMRQDEPQTSSTHDGTHDGHPRWAPMMGTHDGHPWWAPMMGTHDWHPWLAPMMGTHDGTLKRRIFTIHKSPV